MRVTLQNCFGVRVVEQARHDASHNIGAEGATAACVSRRKLQLVRQIGERALNEGFCHLKLQAKNIAVFEGCGGSSLACLA